MTRTVDDIAAHIREVDPDNKAHPADLGDDIARFLIPGFPLTALAARTEEVKDFVFYRNRDKQLDAGRLAELIVAEFDLDKEH
ncbi:MAG: hypothetical protein ABW022_11615 [Actinoplanes sp.]